MRRVLVAALIAASITAVSTPAHAAPREDRWHGACSTWREGETLTPADWSGSEHRRAVAVARIERLIVCEFGKWAPGQSGVALYIADRESSFYPWSVNTSSGCSGIFQHIASAWPARASSYLERWEYADPTPSVFDARANIEVAAKMVASGGWGPWGG